MATKVIDNGDGSTALRSYQARASRISARQRPTDRSLALDDVIAKFPGDWVLLKITAYDRDNIPRRGLVVGHWGASKANDKRISKTLSDLLAEPNDSETQYYLFKASPRIRSGRAMRHALGEASEEECQGVLRAWWRP